MNEQLKNSEVSINPTSENSIQPKLKHNNFDQNNFNTPH